MRTHLRSRRRRWLAAVTVSAAVLGAGLLIITTLREPAAPATVTTPTRGQLAGWFDRLADRGFAGAALVADGDTVLLRSASGHAVDDPPAPATADTIFDLGSIAKQFTAAAILALQEENRLRVTDPISRHLDGVPADKADITIEQLLLHTAGFAHDHADDDLQPMTAAQAQHTILERPLRHRPGTTYAYSNTGYTLAALIIERVTGRPYRDELRARFFEPLGMTATGWFNERQLLGRPTAHGYLNGHDSGPLTTQPGPSYAVIGNGEVLSTVDDMLRWSRALLTGRVLSPTSLAALFTPRVPETAPGPIQTAYGWVVQNTPLGRMVTHNGGGLGGNADLALFPDRGLTVIILSNRITYRWLLDDVIPWHIQLPATEARTRLQDNIAAGTYTDLPTDTWPWIYTAAAITAIGLLLAGGIAAVTKLRSAACRGRRTLLSARSLRTRRYGQAGTARR